MLIQHVQAASFASINTLLASVHAWHQLILGIQTTISPPLQTPCKPAHTQRICCAASSLCRHKIICCSAMSPAHVQDEQDGQSVTGARDWGFQPWVHQAGAGSRGRTSVQEIWDDAASHLRCSLVLVSPSSCFWGPYRSHWVSRVWLAVRARAGSLCAVLGADLDHDCLVHMVADNSLACHAPLCRTLGPLLPATSEAAQIWTPFLPTSMVHDALHVHGLSPQHSRELA